MSQMRQCPFEPTHLIEGKKFTSHLVKCQRQHPDIKLAKCNYDTSHLMREEELKEHLKTCSARGELDVYKYTLSTAAAANVSSAPDPAENLIINTDGPTARRGEGNSLMDDTECWDDSAFKPYDPLESCRIKREENSRFIVPKLNQFAEQSTAAAVLRNDIAQKSGGDDGRKVKQEPSSDEEFGSSALNERQNDLEQFGLRRNASHGGGNDKRVSDLYGIGQVPRNTTGEQNSSRRHESNQRSSYSRRSDSRNYHERERHDRYNNGYSCRERYERPRPYNNDYSNDRHHRDRYDSESHSYRGRYGDDNSSGDRSHGNARYQSYGSFYRAQDTRSRRGERQ